MCFDSCTELTLDRFIKILITQSYEPLRISGNPDLESAWEKIYSEYCSLTGDTSSTHLLQLSKEISYLTNKLEQINQIAIWLDANGRSELIISILQKEFWFHFKYDDLEGDLKKTISIAKADVIKLQRRRAELEQIQNTKGDDHTEQGFIETLQVLSKFQGYQVRAKDITVAEYCALIKDYNAHQKVLNNGR